MSSGAYVFEDKMRSVNLSLKTYVLGGGGGAWLGVGRFGWLFPSVRERMSADWSWSFFFHILN